MSPYIQYVPIEGKTVNKIKTPLSWETNETRMSFREKENKKIRIILRPRNSKEALLKTSIGTPFILENKALACVCLCESELFSYRCTSSDI